METSIKSKGGKMDLYEYNAGTSLAINLKSCVIFAADTRHCAEMTINSRTMSKIYKLNDFTLSITGFYADGYDVYIRLLYSIEKYESVNERKMSIKAAAHVLHNILYSKRFFPYYSYCTLAGFDEEVNEFKLFSFDVVGSYGETDCRVDGSGTDLIQPLLDSRISKKNWHHEEKTEPTEEEVLQLIQSAFHSAVERDVQTGDYLEIHIIRRDKSEKTILKLRQD